MGEQNLSILQSVPTFQRMGVNKWGINFLQHCPVEAETLMQCFLSKTQNFKPGKSIIMTVVWSKCLSVTFISVSTVTKTMSYYCMYSI